MDKITCGLGWIRILTKCHKSEMALQAWTFGYFVLHVMITNLSLCKSSLRVVISWYSIFPLVNVLLFARWPNKTTNQRDWRGRKSRKYINTFHWIQLVSKKPTEPRKSKRHLGNLSKNHTTWKEQKWGYNKSHATHLASIYLLWSGSTLRETQDTASLTSSRWWCRQRW